MSELTDRRRARRSDGPLSGRAIEEDRFPRDPRLDPLRSILEKLDPVAASRAQEAACGQNRQASPQQPATPKGRPRAS
jgi:hypothetical protein